MKTTILLTSLLSSLLLFSCSGSKKEYKQHESIEEATPQQQEQIQKASRSQTDEPTDPEPGHKYLNGRDITNDKQTCSRCQGSGKIDGANCSVCQGYGYVLVYK